MAELFTLPARATDSNNATLSGAKLYFYATGTTTPQVVYEGSNLVTPLANPVVADSGGKFPAMYLDPAKTYRAILKSSDGSLTVFDVDPVGSGQTAADLGYTPAVSGGAGRTIAAKLGEHISLKDFGGVGDGVANDTAAFTAAVDYIESTGNPVFVPPGTYPTDPFVIDPSAYNAQGFFYGLEAASTVIKRRTTGTGAFVTVGASGGTVFQANLVFSGLTIDGGATTNGPACVMYDVVRSRCDGVIFNGGSRALVSYGGIANTFNHCNFQGAQRGLMIDGFAPSGGLSPAGGGWPNILRFNNCHFVDNTEWGVWFDKGRMLVLDKCQIEGNGTTLGASEGGVYVGTGIGDEIEATDPDSLGLIVKDTWFEANRGVADLHLNSGHNSVENSNFFSQSTMVTNDIRIDGGRYRFKNLNMSFGKNANVLENSGASSGNLMEFVQAAALSYNSSKTMVVQGSYAFLGNGAVPGINGATAPLIQTGSDSSSANPTITFNQAFKAGTTPKVYVSQVNDSSGTIEAIDVYAVTNTGFTIRKKSFNGTTIGTVNYTVSWIAVGENP